MIAPAYTMICTANRNGASSSRYITAIVKKFTTRNSAACTALRTTIMPIAGGDRERSEDPEHDVVEWHAGQPSRSTGSVPSGSGGSSSRSFVQIASSRLVNAIS